MFQIKGDSWIEGLAAVSTGPDTLDECLFSFSADGVVCSWELDAEQGCDVYRLLVRGQSDCGWAKIEVPPAPAMAVYVEVGLGPTP